MSLGDLFLPDDDRDLYAHGMSRGGFLVSVDVDAASHDRVVDILDREGTIDTDELEGLGKAGWTDASPVQADRVAREPVSAGSRSFDAGAPSAAELEGSLQGGATERSGTSGGAEDAMSRSLPAADASATSRWSAADATANGSFTRQAFGDEGVASGAGRDAPRTLNRSATAGRSRVRSYSA